MTAPTMDIRVLYGLLDVSDRESGTVEEMNEAIKEAAAAADLRTRSEQSRENFGEPDADR